jgi:hypothetical protein
VTYLCAEFDVGLEELLLWTHADRDTHDLLGSLDILATELKVSVVDPQLKKPIQAEVASDALNLSNRADRCMTTQLY